MGGIEIAADNQLAALRAALLPLFEKVVVKIELVAHTLRPTTAIGEINIVKNKIAVVGGDNAALAIEARRATAGDNLRRLGTCVQCHAGITLLLRADEMRG